ncbi:VUT family protein [Telmatocola sphagniphila]|uniref:VUT family protein n=1 Tax=Telmatocola sphagniphila TaxID=1123043 RepID=A0A8E6B301_9BACT|nr:VUT family protein [Telmatocola sphagniphila]QVL30781.1 VUT family protein [Telmatocola sphagniphila]
MASAVGIEPWWILVGYLWLQLFTGVPFALTYGVDSKLSGRVYDRIRLPGKCPISPGGEFRKCKTAGATAAAAVGAFVWCLVLICHPNASRSPWCYSLIFLINIVPMVLLLYWIQKLELSAGLNIHSDTEEIQSQHDSIKKDVWESILAVGFLEGLLQFSQFYFSIKAIKMLFDKVPTYPLLCTIFIPLLFYIINSTELIGVTLFRRFFRNPERESKKRQYIALKTLLVTVSIFAIHIATWMICGWYIAMDVVAFSVFNIVKGCAGGLSEEWQEALRQKKRTQLDRCDEAIFSARSALIGRLYQIAAIIVYMIATVLVANDDVFDAFHNLSPNTLKPDQNSAVFASTLTVFVFLLLAANLLVYLWSADGTPRKTPIEVFLDGIRYRDQRRAMLTQLLRVSFVVSLVLSNFLAVKLADIRGVSFSHGGLCYVFCFVILHLMVAFEGVEAAVKTVLLGMASYPFVYIALVVSSTGPGRVMDGGGISTDQYNSLFGHTVSMLFVASLMGYIITVVLDMLLMSYLIRYFGADKALVVGAFVTCICQFLDSALFVYIGYFTALQANIWPLIIGQFAVKFCTFLVLYFPLYLFIRMLDRQAWQQGGRVSDAISL